MTTIIYSGSLDLSGNGQDIINGTVVETVTITGTLGITLSANVDSSGNGTASETLTGAVTLSYRDVTGYTFTNTDPLNFTAQNVSFVLGNFSANEQGSLSIGGLNVVLGISGSVNSDQSAISETVTVAASGTSGSETASLTMTASGTLPAETVCFCRGTLILTASGEVPVEDLSVGDQVRTLSGVLKPIVWIGFGRELVTRRNSRARPIVVRKGALADCIPRRDLYLTHGHALYRDGVLIPVENLINHRSIVWDERARIVEYYHIELDDHDVVFAEGAPAESYYDADNRALFHNTRAGSEARADKTSCVPVLNSGNIVETVWAGLLERAGGRIEPSTTADPDVHLLVDGERVDPATIADFTYGFMLALPPRATLRLCSRSGVLSLLGIDRSDHRRLGVPITQIILRHAGISTCFDHDAPELHEGGCHPAEGGYCWTDGEFELPGRFFTCVNGPFTLVVRTKRHWMRYPIAPMPAAAA